MSETAFPVSSATGAVSPLLSAWSVDLETAVCERCQWRFLVPRAADPGRCPHCHQQNLAWLPGGLEEMPHPYPPELVVPFGLADPSLDQSIREFARGIPFTPPDLTPEALHSRLARVYLPVWLVDARTRATWQAEAGFNYQVISHQEAYSQDAGKWQSREVKEDRVRWENRVGRLDRTYQNIPVPALEEADFLKKHLGAYHWEKAVPYRPECLERACVRLPDHTPQEASTEAAAAFQKTAAAECQKASAADHLRQFQWKAQFSNQNWTLLLLPLYTSFYLDDQGNPQAVLINAQTGKPAGNRRASMRRARSASLALLLTGIILILSGVILDQIGAIAPVVALSTLLTLAGIAGAAGAFIPIAVAWDYNRKQALEEAAARQETAARRGPAG